MKVWDQARIKLATPGSALRHVSAVRHVTDCAAQPALYILPGWDLHLHSLPEELVQQSAA